MFIICLLLTLYMVVLFASVILQWIAMAGRLPHYGLGRRVIDAIFGLTNPAFRLVRGLIPSIPMGGAALDLSPVIVFIVVGILRAVICG